MPTPPRRRALAALLAGLIAACGPVPSPAPTAVPTASPLTPATPVASVDAAAVYGAIARQVEQIRGLQPKGDITPVLLDAGQLRANLTASFDRDNPPAAVRETEALYQLLGLLPPGASLRAAELDLLSGQVAGYYDPVKQQLFVVSRSGGIGPSQKVTYAHEFTHQLQDQQFDLRKVQGSATDQTDRSLGRLALIEGDAVSVQTAWTAANLTAADLAQLLADASDPAVVQSLLKAPPILRLLSLAPYTDGQAFVAALQASGGEAAVNAAFGTPPDSSSQVLHPDLYRRGVGPVKVALPSGLGATLPSGWSSLGQDTLGELFIQSWLQASGTPAATAASAADGWAGDRVELFAGPNDALAGAIALRWTSAAEQDAFAAAFRQAAEPRLAPGRVTWGAPGDAWLYVIVASSQPIAEQLAARFGIVLD